MHVVVYFNKENKYSIVNDAYNKLKNSKSAKVNFDGCWYSGEILYRGSENQCIKYAKAIESKPQYEPSDDDSEFEGFDFNAFSTLKSN